MSYPYNPSHPCGTCSQCGGEMVYNVPRLGSSGGYVHKANGKFECPKSEIPFTDDQLGGIIQALAARDKVEQLSDKELSDAVLKLVWATLPFGSHQDFLLDELMTRFDAAKGLKRDEETGEIIEPPAAQ